MHTEVLLYGTKMTGGVTPGKGGTRTPTAYAIFGYRGSGCPRDQSERHDDLRRSRPMRSSEAADAGIKVICAITEGVPVQDMIRVRAVLDELNGGAGTPASRRRFILVGPTARA